MSNATRGRKTTSTNMERDRLTLPADGGYITLLEFRNWLADRNYSPRTRQMYSLYARAAGRDLADRGLSLRRAKFEDLEAWWSTLPRSSSTRNGARHALIAWYRFRGKEHGDPARRLVRVPAPQTLPRPVAEPDFDAFLQAAGELGGIHEALGGLLGYTGCRIGEARRARWHQFELNGETPVWHIEGKGSRRRGPKVRVVPLTDELVVALRHWQTECESADWLFPSSRSLTGYFSDKYLQRKITEVCEAAAIDRATAHRWRHSVATIALDRTNNLRGVQELLGHSSLASTQIYTLVLPGRLREVVDSLKPGQEEPRPKEEQ